MNRQFRVFLLLVLVQTFLITNIAQSQEICIVKSGDYSQYNEAIEGFWVVMSSAGYIKEKGGCEYQLKKDNQSEIVQTIRNKKPKLVFTVGNSATEVFAKLDIPLVFAMVLDPVKYKIVDDLKNPGKNITGVTLEVPIEQQFKAMKETIPEIKRVGVIYSFESAEFVAEGREIAKEMGLEIITQAVRKDDEVIKAFYRLLDSKIDILWLTTDSIVLRTENRINLLKKAQQKEIPVYGLTAAYLKGEAGATLSVIPDYENIGKEAGKLAMKVLAGKTNIAIQAPKKFIICVKKNSVAKVPEGAMVVE